MTVTVKKIGGSVAVLIPRTMARDLDLTEGSPLEIVGTADAITLRKPHHRPRRSVRSIAAGIKSAAYRRRRGEFRDDRPVGREVW